MKIRIINTVLWALLGVLFFAVIIGLLLLTMHKPLLAGTLILIGVALAFGLSISKVHPIYKGKQY